MSLTIHEQTVHPHAMRALTTRQREPNTIVYSVYEKDYTQAVLSCAFSLPQKQFVTFP